MVAVYVNDPGPDGWAASCRMAALSAGFPGDDDVCGDWTVGEEVFADAVHGGGDVWSSDLGGGLTRADARADAVCIAIERFVLDGFELDFVEVMRDGFVLHGAGVVRLFYLTCFE